MPAVSAPDRQSVPSQPPRPSAPADPLRGALLDSRQRWRDLVLAAADLAFETDEWGRFAFVAPDPALGWPAETLIGQPAQLLLAAGADASAFNPFNVTATVRRRRTWLKRGDGGIASLLFCVLPLVDAQGRIVGARGIGADVTELDGHEAQLAAALRRGEVLDHIIWRMGREVLAPRMMSGALDALVNALGAEGAAVGTMRNGTFGRPGGVTIMHQFGGGADSVAAAIAELLPACGAEPQQSNTRDGRPVLVATCQTRFGESAGLAVWRTPEARAWDSDDRLLVAAAANTIRFVLEHEAIQREMARQARTDPLTGLLNRRAFLEEIERCTERLDRDGLPGTLMFADLDNFKAVNDRMGHEVGDQVLLHTTILLRNVVRPTDLVARLGGDEFAIWLNGADQLTAAERAEHLRTQVPRELREIAPDCLTLGVSIGIAARQPGSHEAIEQVIRRADMAMYEVKRHGRGHWRVAPEDAV